MRDAVLTLAIGVGATAIVDAWVIIRKLLFAIRPPDYGLLGRWIAHMRHGRFVHDSIGNASPVPGEKAIGWTTHYLIGIAFAGLLVAISGRDWLHRPTLGAALLVGLLTVLAPFLLMQPATGAGIAGSRTANPGAVRLQALTTHMVFGLGLYLAAVAIAWLIPWRAR